MRRRYSIGLLALIWSVTAFGSGPGPFEIAQMNPRFTPDENPVFASRYNRLSAKSPAGDLIKDEFGLYINPTVTKGAGTGNPIIIGFIVLNRYKDDPATIAASALGTLKKMNLLLNGADQFSMPIEDGAYGWSDTTSYKSPSPFAARGFAETGLVKLTMEQYKRIMTARSIAIEITGSKARVNYDAKSIDPGFLENLRLFHQKQLQ